MNNTIALVTGANKGIGKEIARELARLGHTVLLGARDVQRGKDAAAELGADGSDVRFVQFDVTDEDSVTAAAQSIADEFGRLDVLVNNAGITNDMVTPASETSAAAMREVYEVNVFGVVRTINALLPLLRRSAGARIVNVSSSLGSLTRTSTIDMARLLAYNSSKSALNALTVQYANELRPAGIPVNSVAPGKCATDLNGSDVDRTAADGAQIVIKLATMDSAEPTGGFFEDAGTVPW